MLRGTVKEGDIIDVYTSVANISVSENVPIAHEKHVYVIDRKDGKYRNNSDYMGRQYETNARYRDLLRGRSGRSYVEVADMVIARSDIVKW